MGRGWGLCCCFPKSHNTSSPCTMPLPSCCWRRVLHKHLSIAAQATWDLGSDTSTTSWLITCGIDQVCWSGLYTHPVADLHTWPADLWDRGCRARAREVLCSLPDTTCTGHHSMEQTGCMRCTWAHGMRPIAAALREGAHDTQ